MNALENLIMTAGVFGSAVLIVFIIAKYNYLLKKAIAENGGTAANASHRYSFRDIGLVVLSVGFGLAVSSVFTFFDLSEDTMDLLVFGTILTCGGVGLMIAHHLRAKEDSRP